MDNQDLWQRYQDWLYYHQGLDLYVDISRINFDNSLLETLKPKFAKAFIAVYGNKGSTDQHAYVQQLREGIPNFFATFIEVLEDRIGNSIEVEPDATSGDFLAGFLQGTREALYENQRESITITIPQVNPRTVGALIALYERAVGLYAYH
jgi:glucose-6-phosphate isomerase